MCIPHIPKSLPTPHSYEKSTNINFAREINSKFLSMEFHHIIISFVILVLRPSKKACFCQIASCQEPTTWRRKRRQEEGVSSFLFASCFKHFFSSTLSPTKAVGFRLQSCRHSRTSLIIPLQRVFFKLLRY